MQYNGHKLRHELKYLISYRDYFLLSSRLARFMKRDKNSGDDGYFIRSLYFDDIYDSCYVEKEDGIGRRRKYRIRIYNLDDDVIKFEIKDKFDSYISKSSANITIEQCKKLVVGNFDFMLNSDSKTLRMAFVDARTKLLRPKVIVDYSREVFVGEEGNVRITFDKELRAGIGSFDIFSAKVPTIPAIEDDRLILEVKFDDYLPEQIRELLHPVNRWQTSESKFWRCRKAQNIYYRKDMPYESSLIV
ncbi:MAG: polyphosphate polymerase domain-containing protein [Clostridia bacterium]|nr:polyphosphate polymerase domain-containing protein [Clostridia bacterium]